MRGLGLTACLAALALALAAPAAAQDGDERPLPPPVPVADDALSAALETGELTEAEYALERARSVFQLTRVRREFGDVARPSPRDATLILRDLAVRVRLLRGAERVAAERILARPPLSQGGVPVGDGWDVPEAATSPACGARVCVHWVDDLGSADAPDPLDDDPFNGIPDWVELTLFVWEEIWFQEIDTLGYRAPLSDLDSPANGGAMLLDVYLDDLGSSGVFGYCTSDDPDADDPGKVRVSAYCVIDNDFSQLQYGTQHTPEEFLQVTSAHEFHHASQFAYDWLEDYWFMEGTAANIEETVYPAVDDNVTFLEIWSPLTRPASSLDRGGFGNSEYGSWIFWRFLQEKIGGDPSIVREIWERAKGAKTYSLLAARGELVERGLRFPTVFARFATANRLLDYADAHDAGYPSPPYTKSSLIGLRSAGTPWRSWRINHLAARFFSFRPGPRVAADARLAISARLPKRGARATLIVVEADGSTATRALARNANGYARGRARFGRGVVKRVDVVLSNGSPLMGSCGRFAGPPAYSCFGRPLDDGRRFELRGKLIP